MSPLVYCPRKECSNRTKGSGICNAPVIYLDGRYCSEFGFTEGTVFPIHSKDGYEGFTIVSKRDFKNPESFDGKCPECNTRAYKIKLNLYRCQNDSCEVITFKVASSGAIYDVIKEAIVVGSIESREELDTKLDAPYYKRGEPE